MAQLTLMEVQRMLLDIIASVEEGVTTPEDAVQELEDLKAQAAARGVNLIADYTLADFKLIRENALSEYESEYEEDLYENESFENEGGAWFEDEED